ncbi:hypothetical protein BT69DRAFT_698480 [Atractiella rhizophila]|nr:hypothetical protein BT69DRAFT_698480 [Atractiella rhizophila]
MSILSEQRTCPWNSLRRVTSLAFIGHRNPMSPVCTLSQKVCLVSILTRVGRLIPTVYQEYNFLRGSNLIPGVRFPPKRKGRGCSRRTRSVPVCLACSPSTSRKKKLGKLFSVPSNEAFEPYSSLAKHLQIKFGQDPSDRPVSAGELSHYAVAVNSLPRAWDLEQRYLTNKEVYFKVAYLDLVATELSSRPRSRLTFHSNKEWPFYILPFVTDPMKRTTQYKYRPVSDYEFRDAQEIPRLLVEVQSQDQKQDETRLLLQGAAVVRIAQYAINKMYEATKDDPWSFILDLLLCGQLPER